MTAGDTVFALSTGLGRSAVAVVRVSGRQASSIVTSIAGSLPPPRKLALRQIRHPADREVLDQAMVVWLPGPHSFTGEDCAELHLHGSPAILAAVMEALSSLPGVRPAEPGEFTRRAFLNGKMDLVEAEGLGDLLAATTARQRRQALRQVSGQASSTFESWRERLLLIRADIEAAVDFADEEDVAASASPAIDSSIRELAMDMEAQARLSAGSEIIRDGARVVLAGFPNTGKSSLLNALAGREAAIVSDLPGTTRDSIEVALDLDGLQVIITDTAGLRADAADRVEQEGISRSHRHIAGADLLLWIWSPDVEGSYVPPSSIRPDLFIRNKCDLATETRLSRNDQERGVSISCQTGEGLKLLVTRIAACLRDRYGSAESALLVSARQKLVANRSIRLLNDALVVAPENLEVKAENIRLASEEIGRLTGRVDVEEWLGAIFSRFCIGK